MCVCVCVDARLQARFFGALFFLLVKPILLLCNRRGNECIFAISGFLFDGFRLLSCQQLHIKMHSRLFCMPGALYIFLITLNSSMIIVGIQSNIYSNETE